MSRSERAAAPYGQRTTPPAWIDAAQPSVFVAVPVGRSIVQGSPDDR